MTARFLTDLERELSAAGIRGRLRERIVAEYADHLERDPGARLGSPSALACQFADELGTSRARRAGFHSFGALAVAGVLFAVAFVSAQAANFGLARGANASALGTIGTAIAVLGAQVALAAGLLAALRAFHRRREVAVPRAEAVVIVRRAAVAVAAGIATMAGLTLSAVEQQSAPSWWVTVTVIAAGLGFVALLASVPSLVAAVRLQPAGAGGAGDLFEDIGVFTPAILRGRPWRLALILAGAILVAIALAGVAADDPYDGILRGIADGGACLVGFGLLGRFLGLRA